MYRSCMFGLLAVGLTGVTQAAGQQTCRPELAFKEIRFSPMQPPTMERKWTAILSVDASRCATTSGPFGIVFTRQKENGLERKWTAILSVDASRCATTSGPFGIVFTRQKENGIEMDFQEQFTWKPASVEVSIDLWADEAVERYWLYNVAPCPCRD
jgi:hypothetical protein